MLRKTNLVSAPFALMTMLLVCGLANAQTPQAKPTPKMIIIMPDDYPSGRAVANNASSKTELRDLGRALTPRDMVRVLNNERMTLIGSENIQRALPKQVGLVYKIKVDGQNNLYAIPSPLIGINLPLDTFPVGKGVCSPCSWCNDKSAGGCCETFCYMLLEPDKSTLGGELRAGGDYFTPGKNKSDIDVFSIQQFGKEKVEVRVSGTLSEPQPIQVGGWCACYIEGYGAVAFRHNFRGSCETACEVLNKWYKSTHQ
jgi:hypothetical protein